MAKKKRTGERRPPKKARAKKRTPVGEPLTPAVAREMGMLPSEWPSADGDFDPRGSWSQTWRIWTCHGHLETGNRKRGFLRIERVPDRPDASFTLKIEQQVKHQGGLVHRMQAEVSCRGDEIASPQAWRLRSSFEDGSGQERADLLVALSGERRGRTITVTTGGLSRRVNLTGEVTADWCLFEAVQRLPRHERPGFTTPRPADSAGRRNRRSRPYGGAARTEPDRCLAFDLFEGLTVLRRGQRLVYKGRDGELHRFCQFGRGMLPYEYWLDAKGRLAMVCTLSRAYVLDPRAGGGL